MHSIEILQDDLLLSDLYKLMENIKKKKIYKMLVIDNLGIHNINI